MKFLSVLALSIISTFAIPMMKPMKPVVVEPQMPSFLIGAPEETIESFFDMIANVGDLKDREIDEAVEQWVKEQKPDIQEKYAQFEEERVLRQSIAAIEHKKVVENMSQAAAKADEQISQIAIHPELTAKEKDFLIQLAIRSLSPEIKKELGPLLAVY